MLKETCSRQAQGLVELKLSRGMRRSMPQLDHGYRACDGLKLVWIRKKNQSRVRKEVSAFFDCRAIVVS